MKGLSKNVGTPTSKVIVEHEIFDPPTSQVNV
jgi:hypothetical protein